MEDWRYTAAREIQALCQSEITDIELIVAVIEKHQTLAEIRTKEVDKNGK